MCYLVTKDRDAHGCLALKTMSIPGDSEPPFRRCSTAVPF